MPLSKISARFRKAADAPAPAPIASEPADEAAAAATEPVESVAASPKVAAAPAEPVVRASRLVEGARKPFTQQVSLAAIRQAATTAAIAGRPAAKPIAAAVALAAMLGLGYGLGASGRADTSATAARLAEATEGLRQSHGEMARLAAELKGVKTSVEGLRGSRTDISAKQAQLFDKLDRSSQDNAARIGKLGEQLDRVEKAQRDPARLQAFVERLDRIERGMQTAGAPPHSAPAMPVASAPTPPPKPTAVLKEAAADVQQTGSLAESKPKQDISKQDLAKHDVAKQDNGKPEPDPRKTQLEGYAVRDIDDGYALIETKSGRFVEVSVGQTLPGIGKVEAIERRGRQWVVVTAKGFVGERWN